MVATLLRMVRQMITGYTKIRNARSTYTDATLAVEGKFYHVHKLVMSTYSEYFCDVFERTPCKSPVIVLQEVQSRDIETLLDYMYLGEVKVNKKNLASLLKTAENLKIKGLTVPIKDSSIVPKKSTSSYDEACQDSPPKRQCYDLNTTDRLSGTPFPSPEKLSTVLVNPTQTPHITRLNFKIPSHSTSNIEQDEPQNVKLEMEDEPPDVKVEIEEPTIVITEEGCSEDQEQLYCDTGGNYGSDLSNTNNYKKIGNTDQNLKGNLGSDILNTISLKKNNSNDQDLTENSRCDLSKSNSLERNTSSDRDPWQNSESGLSKTNISRYSPYIKRTESHHHKVPRNAFIVCSLCQKSYCSKYLNRHLLNIHSEFLHFRAKEEEITSDKLYTAARHTYIDFLHKDFSLSLELMKKFKSFNKLVKP
ncbi:unnamed protein product, partial [Meganyctiphanes norvegica]